MPTRPTYEDDSGTGNNGTKLNKSFFDSLFDYIDNSVGAISGATVAFAEIHTHDATGGQTIATGSTYQKIDTFSDAGFSLNCTADAENNKITITEAGKYFVSGSFSFTCDTNNVVFMASAFLGGVEQNNVHWLRNIGTGADAGAAGFSGFIDAPAGADLDVRVRHEAGANVSLVMKHANLSAIYLG